jgi:hypothetical protein
VSRVLHVLLEVARIERDDVLPPLGPVAPVLLELLAEGVDLGASVLVDVGPARFLHEDRHAVGHRVNAEDAHQLEHLQDLLDGRTLVERVPDVSARARTVQVRRRDVDGDVDELPDLRVEFALLPGVSREPAVPIQEVGIELEDIGPVLRPVAALLEVPFLDLRLPFRQLRVLVRHTHRKVTRLL